MTDPSTRAQDERKELKWLDDFRADVAMAELNDTTLFMPREYSEKLIANIERLSAALAASEHGRNEAALAWTKLTDSQEQEIAELRDALAASEAYATRLAMALWEKHYKTEAPDWQPLSDLLGVLTQIDNMTTGLTTLAASEAKVALLEDNCRLLHEWHSASEAKAAYHADSHAELQDIYNLLGLGGNFSALDEIRRLQVAEEPTP